jgi:dephospho-CoA kinase
VRSDDNARRPLRVIVSGGIGSGKTTVTRLLGERGVVVIEADRIGHEILEPGGAAFDVVAGRWPEVVVSGRIERSRLAAIVFSDQEQLAELEAITHPLIGAEIARRVNEAEDRDVVVELPVADDRADSGWIRVVVDAPGAIRETRAVARGMARADVARRLAAQPGRNSWLSRADYVIDNRGSLTDLETQVDELWADLTATSTG